MLEILLDIVMFPWNHRKQIRCLLTHSFFNRVAERIDVRFFENGEVFYSKWKFTCPKCGAEWIDESYPWQAGS